MIYKFKSKDNCSFLELSKEEDKVLVSILVEDQQNDLYISKETLYSLIGALHSLQTKIKKEGCDE